MSTKIDLDELERRAVGFDSLRDNVARLTLAPNGATVIALIARIRELDAAIVDVLENASLWSDTDYRARLSSILEKGAVLP